MEVTYIVVVQLFYPDQTHAISSVIMRPSSLGGGRILRRTLSVCLSVCLSVRPSRARMYFVYICTVLRANIQNRKTSVLDYGPASRMYFSARAEGRISYGHLGRTSLFYTNLPIKGPYCACSCAFCLSFQMWSMNSERKVVATSNLVEIFRISVYLTSSFSGR